MTARILLEAGVRACVLGAAVWVLLRLFRVRAPAQERAAWLAVLVASASMPLLVPLAGRAFAGAAPVIRYPAAVDALLAAPPPAATGMAGAGGGGAGLVFALYLAVAAVLAGRLALGVLALVPLWRGATPLPGLSAGGVPVRCSPRVRVPATIGRGILLPAEWRRWDEATLECVLAHERSHARRGDFYWQLLARAYACLFWASPLSAWLAWRLSILAEHLSDADAVVLHGDPPGYAEMLVGFSRLGRGPVFAAGIARRSSIAVRVDRILAPGAVVIRGSSPPLLVAALVALAAGAASLPRLARAPVPAPAPSTSLVPAPAASTSRGLAPSRAELSPLAASRLLEAPLPRPRESAPRGRVLAPLAELPRRSPPLVIRRDTRPALRTGQYGPGARTNESGARSQEAERVGVERRPDMKAAHLLWSHSVPDVTQGQYAEPIQERRERTLPQRATTLERGDTL